MAKPVKSAADSGFKIDEGIALPPRAVGGRGGGGVTYPFDQLRAPKGDTPGTSFLIPVSVPDTITDATERKKAFKEGAKRIANRLSGAVRRYTKTNPSQSFAIRTVDDDTAGRGVRVWREKDRPKAA